MTQPTHLSNSGSAYYIYLSFKFVMIDIAKWNQKMEIERKEGTHIWSFCICIVVVVDDGLVE